MSSLLQLLTSNIPQHAHFQKAQVPDEQDCVEVTFQWSVHVCVIVVMYGLAYMVSACYLHAHG